MQTIPHICHIRTYLIINFYHVLSVLNTCHSTMSCFKPAVVRMLPRTLIVRGQIPLGGTRCGIVSTTKKASSLLENSSKVRYDAPYYPRTSPFQLAQNTSLPSSPNSNLASFTQLLQSITDSLCTAPPSIPYLYSLLQRYNSDSSEWSKYAHANSAKQYTRNLVCEVPKVFNLLLLVWTPGKGSPVHDHADAHCLMKVIHFTCIGSRDAHVTRS